MAAKTKARKDVPSIIEFIEDPMLGNWPSMTVAQRAKVKALDGLALNADELDAFRKATGLQSPSGAPYRELTDISGARSGKNLLAAFKMLHAAMFPPREPGRGERLLVAIISQDDRATEIQFSYLTGILKGGGLLKGMLVDDLTKRIALASGVEFQAFPCTQSAPQGWTIIAATLDELASWRLEGAVNSDILIQRAVRRGMLTWPGPLMKTSVPYLKSGVVWDDYQKFGEENPAHLVWHLETAAMRPELGEEVAAEYERDPEGARRYFGAEFLDGVNAWLQRSMLQACVVKGRGDLAKKIGCDRVAAIDPSGLTENDAWTLAIVRTEGERHIVEAVRAYEGTDDQEVIGGHVQLLREYGLDSAIGDRYSGNLASRLYLAHGIRLTTAGMDKSEAYLESEKVIRRGQIELPDDPRLLKELGQLERRYHSGNRVTVDHPAGARFHDDVSNAVCLAVAYAERKRLGRMAQESMEDEEASRPDPDAPRRRDMLSKLIAQAIATGHDPAVLEACSNQVGDDVGAIEVLAAEIENWLLHVQGDTLTRFMREG